MQAIQTKFLGPTNHRGARIKAVCDAGSITVAWDYQWGIEENHVRAAMALAAKLEWFVGDYGVLHNGTLPDGSFCHVFVK